MLIERIQTLTTVSMVTLTGMLISLGIIGSKRVARMRIPTAPEPGHILVVKKCYRDSRPLKLSQRDPHWNPKPDFALRFRPAL